MKSIVKVMMTCISLHLHAQTLDELALHYDSDKGPQWHHYTRIYEQVLAPFKEMPITFLEIGFARGASAAVWDNYFHANAQLHFIDIDPACTAHAQSLSTRCTLHITDQEEQSQLRAVMQRINSGCDIIIDDGGHTMAQQLISFQVLFPHVKKGGLYIIEDLYTSYLKRFGSEGTIAEPKASDKSMIKFLYTLIDALNYGVARSFVANKAKWPERITKTLSRYQRSIRSIHFYPGLCIIVKD